MRSVKKFALFFALVLAGFSSVVPASAHTTVDSTTPATGTSVDAGPQTVTVNFTEPILTENVKSEIQITDENGNSVETSCIDVQKLSVSLGAFFATAGKYTATWRVVASDGDPVTGNFSFEVTGTADDQAGFVTCKDAATQTAVIATPKAATPATKTDSTGAGSSSLIIFLIGAAVIIAAGAFWFIRRQKSKTKE